MPDKSFFADVLTDERGDAAATFPGRPFERLRSVTVNSRDQHICPGVLEASGSEVRFRVLDSTTGLPMTAARVRVAVVAVGT